MPHDEHPHNDAHHGDADHEAHHGEAHHGAGQYWFVFLALCVLTTMSFFTYSRLWPWPNEPEIGRTFMMAVSCTKAMLVILFFMHVKYEANWKYVLTIPPGVMAIFLMLALVPDIGLRGRSLSEERLEHMAEPRAEQPLAHHAAEEHVDGEHAEGEHELEEDHDGQP